MAQASGVFKQVKYKVESVYGTVPAAASSQALRRVSSDLDLRKDSFNSNEIRTDQQTPNPRHGTRRIEGSINGELSPGTYKDFIAAALRRDFAAVTAITGLSITIAGSGPTYTVVRGSGSWLADGVKKGDVIRLSVGSLNAANISKNLLVTNAVALTLTVRPLNGVALVAEGPIATTTATVVGKKTYVPASGHTNQSFSIEHWYADIVQSEVFSGCQPTTIDLQLPPTGLATIAIGFMGKDITTAAAEYFTSPTAATTSGLTAAVNGIVLVNGTAVALLTGLTMQIQSARSGDPVVGSNTIPVRFPGRITVSGQATAYFEDATLRDTFINETEFELVVVLSADNTAASKFVGITLPACKSNGAAKSDGEGGLVQTIPFTAGPPATGGAGVANELSTIVVQDSDA